MLYSRRLNLIVTTLYRQPDDSTHGHPSKANDFSLAIDAIKRTLDNIDGPLPLVIIGGDFNLPNLYNSKNPSKEEKLMIRMLQEFCLDQSLGQIIYDPTHKDGNILDLILTNDIQHVHSHSVIPTINSISHHYLLHVATRCVVDLKNHNSPRKIYETFANLNFFHQDTKWENIKLNLSNIDWDSEFDGKSVDEILEIFHKLCYESIVKYVPLKNDNAKSTKSKTEKECYNLTRRRRRINKLLLKITSPQRKYKLHQELILIEVKFQKLSNFKLYKEQKAINTIKVNPKFFYSYAKSMSKSKTSIGPLLNNLNESTSDDTEMSNILAEQYSKVFSTPQSSSDINVSTESPDGYEKPYQKLLFTESDLIKAINELLITAAAGPDNFPAILLKTCKQELITPVYKLWKASFDQGVVPERLKKSIITPVHKGGSKANAANYRPISLTSHIIKVFEKVVRNHIATFMEENSLFNPNQHGFRKGHSCLSELLDHYDNILDLLNENNHIDVIYLDFAKAFDKVDFGVVLRKIKKLGIDDQTFNWISSFLINRTQRVLVNGKSSDTKPVISEVPQGSVLGPLIFLILLGDIDENVTESKVRSFADDTRIMKGIKTLKILPSFKMT